MTTIHGTGLLAVPVAPVAGERDQVVHKVEGKTATAPCGRGSAWRMATLGFGSIADAERIDLQSIWTTVKDDLPALKAGIEHALRT